MSTEKKKYPFLKTMLRVIPIQYKSTPWHCAINNCIGIFHGLSFSLAVIATQNLFDAISNAAIGKAGFLDCLIPIIVLAGITFFQQIINGAHNFHATVMLGKSSGKISVILHRKLLRIDPAQYEDTDFLDDVNKAREGAKVAPNFGISLSNLLFFYSSYFASIGM